LPYCPALLPDLLTTCHAVLGRINDDDDNTVKDRQRISSIPTASFIHSAIFTEYTDGQTDRIAMAQLTLSMHGTDAVYGKKPTINVCRQKALNAYHSLLPAK